MRFLEPGELRQLELFAWFLLVINACIVGIGVLLGRSMEDGGSGVVAMVVVAALVDGAFVVIVGADLTRVVARRWRHRHAGAHRERGEEDR